MKKRLLVVERLKEALRSIKAEAVRCLICDTEFRFKKNLYRHLKKPCQPVYTTVKPRLCETPNMTSPNRNILSDLEDPNPWDDEEEALEPEHLEPEPEKGTLYTPPP